MSFENIIKNIKVIERKIKDLIVKSDISITISQESQTVIVPNIPASVPSIIIQDIENSIHGQTLRNEFMNVNSNYELTDFEFNMTDGAYPLAIDYGADIIIRSTEGLEYQASVALDYKENILLVIPLGSNSNVELDYNGALFPWVICTGAGDTVNKTAFGNNLDFFDIDDIVDDSFLSSFSNGRIAGKLKAIKDARGDSWWDTINAARETATRTATTHPSSEKWNKNNGYGIIDVSTAITYVGVLPTTIYFNE
jgi:hypothetical protein